MAGGFAASTGLKNLTSPPTLTFAGCRGGGTSLSMKALISCELIGTFIFLTYFGTVIRGNKIHHSLPVSYRNQLFILGLEGEKEHLCVVVFVEREPHQRLGEGARSRKVDFVVSRPRFGCLGLPGGA